MIIEHPLSYWISVNPIPSNQATCIERDTKRVKYGDGSTNYNSLLYSGFILTGNSLIVDPASGGGISELTLISGAIDDVNTVFVWSAPPVLLFWGGQCLREGTGYTLAGSTTTLTNPPNTGDDLWAYGNSGSKSFKEIAIVSGVVDGVNDTFVLAAAPLQVFVEGQMKVATVGYNLTGVTIVFTAGNIPQVGDNITAFGVY